MAFADVNGDGIPDLILAATDNTNGWYDLYVIYGQSNRYNFPNPFQVSSLNGTNGFTITDITPISSDEPVNLKITTADVNGDGIPDIIIEGSDTNCQRRAGWQRCLHYLRPKGKRGGRVAGHHYAQQHLLAAGDDYSFAGRVPSHGHRRCQRRRHQRCYLRR